MSALVMLFVVLLVATGLASFVGWIWLVVRGFQASVGWGLALLFFAPIAAIVAAVRDWPGWKRPVLLYFGGAGTQLALALVFFLVIAPMTMAKAIRLQAADAPVAMDASAQVEPPTDARAGVLQVRTEEASAPIETAPRPAVSHVLPYDPIGRSPEGSVARRRSAPGKYEPSEVEVPDDFAEIPLAAAGKHAGSAARLVGKDGRIHSGTLVRGKSDGVEMEFYVGGGTVGMEFSRAEIRSLQVRR